MSWSLFKELSRHIQHKLLHRGGSRFLSHGSSGFWFCLQLWLRHPWNRGLSNVGSLMSNKTGAIFLGFFRVTLRVRLVAELCIQLTQQTAGSHRIGKTPGTKVE